MTSPCYIEFLLRKHKTKILVLEFLVQAPGQGQAKPTAPHGDFLGIEMLHVLKIDNIVFSFIL